MLCDSERMILLRNTLDELGGDLRDSILFLQFRAACCNNAMMMPLLVLYGNSSKNEMADAVHGTCLHTFQISLPL